MKRRYKILSGFIIILFLAISVNAAQEFWGSSTSTRYHFPTCEWAKKIRPEKRIVFHSPEEAIKAGYEPCPVCRPPLVSLLSKDEKEKAILASVKKDAIRPANLKNVLFVTAANPDYPATSSFISAVKRKLDDDFKNKINYSFEYIHPSYYHPDAEQEVMLVSFLKQKYQIQQPDIVIAHLAPLINKYADTIFPEVPVIYSGSENDFSDPRTAPNLMSYQGLYDFKKTLPIIIQLQPEIKKIYIVLGDSEDERKALPKIAKATQEFDNQLEFVYLNKQPLAEILKLAATLDNKSAILYVSIFRDAEGKTFLPEDVLRLLGKEASAPIYGIGAQYLGAGSVGGYIINREVQGKHAAEIAVQILNGKKMAEIRRENVSLDGYAFDWRELQHWKIDEKKLPQGSRVEFRQHTAWDLYKWQIILVLLIVALVIAIVFLINSRSKKAPVEITLQHLQPEENLAEESPAVQPEVNNKVPFAEEIHPVAVTVTAVVPVEAPVLKEQPASFEADGLTGLYSREQMEEKIREEVDCFQRNIKAFSKVAGSDIFKDVKSFSLMIGDIDFFQKIKETHGREAVDNLLKSLAEDFPKLLRACDLVARWREEEFLFLLPEINLDGAKAVAERIRKKIEEQTYVHGETKLSATMTFGVSTIRINDTANDLLKRVDNALFKGKNTGGNCVVSA
jgi:diguanylate cyclase (GGDEF)-like protein